MREGNHKPLVLPGVLCHFFTIVAPPAQGLHQREDLAICAIVERWLGSIEQLLPGSSAALWLTEPSGAMRVSDDRMIRMLRLQTERPWQLGLLSDEHLRVMAAKVGRVNVPREYDDSMTRRPTSKEVAQALGMTHRRYRRLVEEAHKLVRLAIEQRRAA